VHLPGHARKKTVGENILIALRAVSPVPRGEGKGRAVLAKLQKREFTGGPQKKEWFPTGKNCPTLRERTFPERRGHSKGRGKTFFRKGDFVLNTWERNTARSVESSEYPLKKALGLPARSLFSLRGGGGKIYG